MQTGRFEVQRKPLLIGDGFVFGIEAKCGIKEIIKLSCGIELLDIVFVDAKYEPITYEQGLTLMEPVKNRNANRPV